MLPFYLLMIMITYLVFKRFGLTYKYTMREKKGGCVCVCVCVCVCAEKRKGVGRAVRRET